MNMRVVVVDDEPLARARLIRLIDDIDTFTVVAEADSGHHLDTLLEQYQADIVILDIHLPGLSGLELAATLSAANQPPAIIFCTAYEQHALAAFDYQAVDYILKPARKERLEAALQRAAALQESTQSREQPHLLIQNTDGLQRVPWADVRGLLAEDKYVTVLTATATYLSNTPLAQFEQEQGAQLLRVHRNALVVTENIIGLVRNEQGYSVQLQGLEKNLAVSRRHLAQVRRQLKDNQHRLP